MSPALCQIVGFVEQRACSSTLTYTRKAKHASEERPHGLSVLRLQFSLRIYAPRTLARCHGLKRVSNFKTSGVVSAQLRVLVMWLKPEKNLANAYHMNTWNGSNFKRQNIVNALLLCLIYDTITQYTCFHLLLLSF